MRALDAQRTRLAPTAFLVVALLGAGSLAPVLRDALVAARLGATNESDAYFLATYIMLMVVTVLVADSFTPASVVSLSQASDGESGGLRLRHAFLAAALVLSAVAALVALLAGPLVALLAPGFDDATRALAVDAARAVAPGVALLGLAWLVTSYLNAAGYFLLPAMITPIVAVGAAIPLLAGTDSPVIAAAGWSLGAAMALAILLGWAVVVAIRGSERQPHPDPEGAHTRARLDVDALRRLLPNAAPLLILVTITQSAEIVDRIIPSGVEVGALTTVALAKKTMNLPHTILIAAVGAVTLPFISRESSAGRSGRAFVETINLALFFLLPITALLAIGRSEIVTVLYGRGEFSAGDIRETADLLGVYALALIPVTLGVILQRSFSTIGRSWAPLPVYAVAIGGYIVGAWLGVGWFGLLALPVVFTLAQVGYVAALMVRLNRYLSFSLDAFVWPTGIALFASFVATLAGLAGASLVPNDAWFQLVTLTGLAGASYVLLVVWLRHPAANDLLLFFGWQRAPAERGLRVGIDATYAAMQNGTGRYLSALIEELAQRPDIDLVRFRAPRIERLPRVLRLPLNGGMHLLWSQVVLPVWAWQQGVAVIHTSMIGPLLTPCPQLLTVHDGLDFRPEWRPSVIWSAYVRLLGTLAARRSAAVVTVSHAAAEDVQRYFRVPPERLHVVWNGARPLATATDDAPLPGLEPGRFVLVVGSRARYKNHETAIAAVGLVRERYADIEIVLVGSGLEQLVKGRPWVRAPGRLPDNELGWLYERAALCCVPSLHEGFGLPIVEAFVYGVPVVASDIPALREVGGEGARFADPLDPAAFAAAMLDVIDHQRAERERIAPVAARAAERTWQRATNEIVEIYASLVDPSPGGTQDPGEDGRAWAHGGAS